MEDLVVMGLAPAPASLRRTAPGIVRHQRKGSHPAIAADGGRWPDQPPRLRWRAAAHRICGDTARPEPEQCGGGDVEMGKATRSLEGQSRDHGLARPPQRQTDCYCPAPA